MAKEICISTTPHETRLAILEDDQLAEIYYERENEYTLAGSIYKGRVTRVLPGMQSSFVDVGLERDAFLYVTDFLEEQEDSEEYASDGNGGGRQARPRSESEEGQEPARMSGPDRNGPERNRPERSPERNSERQQDRGRRPAAVATVQPDPAREPAREGGRAGRERVRELTVAPLREAVPAAQDLEEKGDEESAEGTRRWRGRRGRRRGVRGSLQKTEPQSLVNDSPPLLEDAGDDEDGPSAPFALAEHGAPGGIAAIHASPEKQEEEPVRRGAQGRDGGPRRAREPYAQASTLDRPARDAERKDREFRTDEGTPPTAGTIVLPGESLSKYGSAPADPATVPAVTATVPRTVRPVNYVAPKPSTLVELSADWDGGAVLPGETLSRYREPVFGAAQAVASGLIAFPSETKAASPEVEPVVAANVPTAAESTPIAAEANLDQPALLHSSDTPIDEVRVPAHEELAHEELAHEKPVPEVCAAAELPVFKPFSEEHAGGASFDPPAAAILQEAAAETEHVPVEEFAGRAEPEIVAAAVSPAETLAPFTAEPEDAGAVTENARQPQTEEAASAALSYGKPEVAIPAEYEPENASVSYRVQRMGPSELRIASPERDEETAVEAPAYEWAPIDHPAEGERPDDTFAEPSGHFADADPAPQPEQMRSFHEEVTELSGTLAGHSEADDEPHSAAATERQARVEPEPLPLSAAATLRIFHEDGTVDLAAASDANQTGHAESPDATAESVSEARELEVRSFDFEPILSAAAQRQQEEAERAYPSSTEFSDLVDRMQGFAPGHGLLEEETIDEDEYDFEPMHAHAEDGDQEDLEEETLDQRMEPAVLSDAVRDSHLEQRVQRVQEASEPAAFVAEEEEAAFGYEEVEGEDEFEEEGESEAEFEEPAQSAQPGEPHRNGRGDEGRGRNRSGGGRSGGRNGARRNGPGRGRSAQTQDLPIISELLKQGQEILVQIAKEPIAKKGARITSHIALPGRFLVFMPTVHHVGVSRKIASDEERQRLKRILISEKGENSGGFIVRTAAEGASEEDLRADLRFLISLWTEVKQRSDTAKAPALIYHDLNLIERILRDQVSSNFSTIWVDSEAEYERIIRFLSRFQPQLVRRVKLYTKETPLFEHFGIQEEISKALKSKVWLKSGGSIVINQTEALVAIDINTGKFVGKTSRLEDTIVKTNLDAIPEIVRQIRLRDLGGIIVIDFIDMDERKNRNRVLAALEEELKNDRAPSKVLQFNDFGLVAITRKRVKQSLERTLSVQCETCTGTGMVKSPITVCNEIYTEMRKMLKHLDGKDVMLRVNPEVVKQLKANNGKWINELEELVTKTIIIKSDPALHPEQFDIH